MSKALPQIARHVSRAKAERLVASGRVFAGTLTVFAALIGSAGDAGASADLAIAAGWWLTGAGLLWWTRRRPHARTSPLVLVVDLAFIAALLMSTGGVGSVYFPTIVIPAFAANLLYGRRGIVWTVAGTVAVYTLAFSVTHANIDPRHAIMRLGVVVLVGIIIVKRAEYEERVHRDIEQLATWPREIAANRDATMRDLLVRAADTLRASRIAAVWTDSGASACFAELENGAFQLDEESFEQIAAPELGPVSSFLSPGLRTRDGVIEEWPGPFLAPALHDRLRARTIIGARFVSQTAAGWLFILDSRDPSADDVMLAEIVARLVSAGIDQINFVAMQSDHAAAAERIRLSRDLHDGLLQSLSGLALHAQSARRAVQADPQGAQQHLQVVVEQLAEGQRSLRDFVEELRPELAERRQSVRVRLEQIAREIASQQSVGVALEVAGQVDAIPPELAGHVVHVVTEALTNAVRHAAATHVRAAVSIEGADVRIDVENDGRGFPFQGQYDLRRLIAERLGPWSIKERVVSLGGDLVIDSSASGSRVALRLPLTG